jgi:hypothetical protein
LVEQAGKSTGDGPVEADDRGPPGQDEDDDGDEDPATEHGGEGRLSFGHPDRNLRGRSGGWRASGRRLVDSWPPPGWSVGRSAVALATLGVVGLIAAGLIAAGLIVLGLVMAGDIVPAVTARLSAGLV